MAGIMAVCAISSLLILHIGNRIIRYKASKELVDEEAVDLMANY